MIVPKTPVRKTQRNLFSITSRFATKIRNQNDPNWSQTLYGILNSKDSDESPLKLLEHLTTINFTFSISKYAPQKWYMNEYRSRYLLSARQVFLVISIENYVFLVMREQYLFILIYTKATSFYIKYVYVYSHFPKRSQLGNIQIYLTSDQLYFSHDFHNSLHISDNFSKNLKHQ